MVGANGSGKSTILQVLAQSVRPSNGLWALKNNDFDDSSSAIFRASDKSDEWYPPNRKYGRWKNTVYQSGRTGEFHNINLTGMYEGSLFVGTRFQDSKIVDDLVQQLKISPDNLIDADDYVRRNLSYILHGDYQYYPKLKRLKNRQTADDLGLKNLPYFIESEYGGLISQYRMSSGECLLVSLLHFINNAVIRSRSTSTGLPLLMLMDEIELALHPVAVSRFLDLLEDLVKKYTNVIAILTTHAPEVIRRISPNNTFKLENEKGKVTAINPCYPSYAIRELYKHDKYDYLILCEDVLAKSILERLINDRNICKSKLIHVLPVGGWENVLKLQDELLRNNILGVGAQVISILDGDIQNECNNKDEYKPLKKIFLPIPSVEKFLVEIIYRGKDKELKKIVGDKYFQLKSIDSIASELQKEHEQEPKHFDKFFYRTLINDLGSRRINEKVFILSLCDDIVKSQNYKAKFDSFCTKLQQCLS